MSELVVAPAIKRVTFLVDGFNVYHSLKAAANSAGGGPYKWLDLASFCRSYLYVLGPDAEVENVHYFSALAFHLRGANPRVVARHRVLLQALEASGVMTHLSQFKRKDRACDLCGGRLKIYEEKKTDVAIASKLLELAVTKATDTLVLVSGDTDLIPALETAKRLAPSVRLAAVFPFGRHNREIQRVVDISFTASAESYASHQFSPTLRVASGKIIQKPVSW